LNAIFVRGFPLAKGYGGEQAARAQGVSVGVGVGEAGVGVGVNVAEGVGVNVAVAVGVNVAVAVGVNVAVAVGVNVAVAVGVNVAVAVGVNVAVAVGVNVAVAVGVNVAVAVGVNVAVAVGVNVAVAVAVGVSVAVAVAVGVNVAVAVAVGVSVAVAVAVGVNVAVAVAVGVSVAVAVAVGVNVAVGVDVAVGVGVGGRAVVEAENENTPLAGGFWVLNVHEPGVESKPVRVIVPVPLTLRNPLACRTMVDAVRLNVNPPTLQRAGSPSGELKFQGAVIVTEVPTGTDAKSPDRLVTVGGKLFPLSQLVTWIAVLTEPVLRCAPPLIVMEPLIGAASSVTPAPSRATAAKNACLIVLFIFWG
jgi:hypothetical protein